MRKIYAIDVSIKSYGKMVKGLEQIVEVAEDGRFKKEKIKDLAEVALSYVEPNAEDRFVNFPDEQIRSMQEVLDILVDLEENYMYYSWDVIIEKTKNVMRNIGYEEEYPV